MKLPSVFYLSVVCVFQTATAAMNSNREEIGRMMMEAKALRSDIYSDIVTIRNWFIEFNDSPSPQAVAANTVIERTAEQTDERLITENTRDQDTMRESGYYDKGCLRPARDELRAFKEEALAAVRQCDEDRASHEELTRNAKEALFGIKEALDLTIQDLEHWYFFENEWDNQEERMNTRRDELEGAKTEAEVTKQLIGHLQCIPIWVKYVPTRAQQIEENLRNCLSTAL